VKWKIDAKKWSTQLMQKFEVKLDAEILKTAKWTAKFNALTSLFYFNSYQISNKKKYQTHS